MVAAHDSGEVRHCTRRRTHALMDAYFPVGKPWVADVHVPPNGLLLVSSGRVFRSVSLQPMGGASGVSGASARLLVGKNPNWVEIVDFSCQ